MSIKFDLHLYYDLKDNSKSGEEELGWAENFKRFLRIMLRQFLGRDPVFYEWEADATDTPDLSEIKALLFIISPQSIESPELHSLITDFKEKCESRSVSDLTFASRIFKIVKLPVPLVDQPEEIRALLPFDLYDYDPVSGRAKEIVNFFSQEAEMNYWMKLVDLAYDIHEVLTHFEKNINSEISVSNKKSVFLAETGPELIVQRNMVKRELLRQGYLVHPDRNLPDDPDHLTKEVADILNNCNYSIHLMGDHVVSSSGVSIAEVQNSVVSDYLKSNKESAVEGFSRLIWLSPNFKVKDEREQAFLETMRRDLEDVGHTEIFQTPFEDFKFVLKNSLIDVSETDLKLFSSNGNSSKKRVYVIYDKIDRENSTALVSHLKQDGFSVLEPSFEGDLMDIRQLHIQNLIDFDAVIIYAGKVNSFWVKMKLLDILKSPGFGRIKPLDHKSIYLESPELIGKSEFENYEVSILEKTGRDFGVVDEFINS